MFKKIILATDASFSCDLAAKVAFEVSAKYGSELIVFHVRDVSDKTGPFVEKTGVSEKSYADPECSTRVKEAMKHHYDFLDEKYGSPAYCTARGEPAQEILKFALENQVECIIMGARVKNTGTHESGNIAGQTLHQVALGASCPVLSVARPCETCFWYFSQIVFATDFSASSNSAFQLAYKLADYIGCKLHLFHAVKIDACTDKDIPSQIQIEDRIEAATARIEKEYAAQMENFDNYDIVVREGIPYVEVLKFTREKSGDLLVMACQATDTGPEPENFDSSLEQVVLRSACPVLTVNQTGGFDSMEK